MKNVRVSPSPSRSKKPLLEEKPKAPTDQSKARTIQSESDAVKLRIKRLRNFVKKAPALAKQQMEDRRNIVPPMEPSPRKKKGSPAEKRLPYQKAKMARRRTLRLAFEFLVLALIIAAIIGWLNQSFHFFS